ncbi:hypothetical protein [Salinimicrobium soli]|uniref:hypothetical protein n=1 Tax=Salinimicrobium soli TaxID=1254399 RepID=UPI003AAF559B
MKAARFLTLALSLFVLLQSCSIYRSKSLSVEEAVAFNRKVKIKTNSNQTFTFKRLEKDEGRLVGVTPRNSKAARKLGEIIETNDSNKFVKVKLDQDSIEQIKAKNYLGSFFVVLGVIVAGLTLFLTWMASSVAFLP